MRVLLARYFSIDRFPPKESSGATID